MASKIFWTKAEWEIVAQNFNTQVDKTEPMYKQIIASQKTLPANRQRGHICDVNAFKIKVKEVFDAMPRAAIGPKETRGSMFSCSTLHKPYVQPSVVEKPVPDLFHISRSVELTLQSEVNKHVASYAAMYQDMVSKRISEVVAKRFAELEACSNFNISEMVEKEFSAQVERTQKNYGVYVDKVVNRKRAVIVGLLGSQAAQVQQLVGDSLSLTFLQSDAAIHQIRKSSQSADYVLMMRKFISHKCTNAVNKNNHSGFFLIDGGMTELEEKLISLV